MSRRATVIGSGPNGLTAAVVLARFGFDVQVCEAAPQAGGALRSAPLTLPGFVHDLGSAVHPAALASPIFGALGLADNVDWIVPEASYAHPLDGGDAAVAWRDLDRTVDELGAAGRAWRATVRPLSRHIDALAAVTGTALLRPPSHPVTAMRYGFRVLEQGTALRLLGQSEASAALMAGVMAHANTRMPSLAAAAAGLLLAAHGHAGGWPVPRGGAQSVADALIADLRAHGGVVHTGVDVTDIDAFDSDLTIVAASPRLLLTSRRTPDGYARALRRFRYGPGAAKVDFALSAPVPWHAPAVGSAPTVHLGGTQGEIIAAENAVGRGRVPENPYVLVTQPSTVDATRAPAGHASLWAYTHVPLGSDFDPTELIIRQIERFAPGFRDVILAHHTTPAAAMPSWNPALVGGDVAGGSFTVAQAIRRPVASPIPWRTPIPGVYLASASTPPGPAVHGMAGWHAARTAIADATGQLITTDDVAATA